MTWEVLDRRSLALRAIVPRLRALEAKDELGVPIAEFLDSCIHMHVNRLLPLDESGTEQALYEFLARWYESRLGQEWRGPHQ